MTTVVNVRRHAYDVYCGRGRYGRGHMDNMGIGCYGWLGNPFIVGEHRDPIHSFTMAFLERLEVSPSFRKAVLALRGKRLGCFCVREPWTPADGGEIVCHAQVIARWIEEHS